MIMGQTGRTKRRWADLRNATQPLHACGSNIFALLLLLLLLLFGFVRSYPKPSEHPISQCNGMKNTPRHQQRAGKGDRPTPTPTNNQSLLCGLFFTHFLPQLQLKRKAFTCTCWRDFSLQSETIEIIVETSARRSVLGMDGLFGPTYNKARTHACAFIKENFLYSSAKRSKS